MPEQSAMYWVLVPAALIGGFLRGYAGFGGPLVLVPIMSFFLPPAVAVGVLMWIDLFVNVRLVPEARAESTRAIVVPLMIGTALAMPAGVFLLLSVEPTLMKKVICGAILVAALVLLTGWRYPRPIGKPVYGAVGAISGFVMGATSLGVITPLFLSAGNLTVAQSRANFILWIFASTILLIVLLTAQGALATASIAMIAVLAPAYFAGTWAGSRAYRNSAERTVRYTVLALVIASASAGLLL
jgi:uncharacterized membrane protein YfcA